MEELTLEQQFEVRKMAEKASRMSNEQLKETLLLFYAELMIQKTMYQKMLQTNWGL